MSGVAQVSVLIPHIAATEHLARCLESLHSTRVGEIIVVVPRTAKESIHLLKRYEQVRMIETPSSLSFARATNSAAFSATNETLLLLNDDTIVERGAIALMESALASRPELGIAGAHLFNTDGSVQPSLYSDPSWRAFLEVLLRPFFRHRPLNALAQFPYSDYSKASGRNVWVSGAALMISRSLYQEVSGLDERFSHGIEDAALCRTVRERGYRVELIPGAQITHQGGVSGFRNASDSETIAEALVGGAHGWMRYWQVYRHAGRIGMTLLRASLVLFGFSRLVTFSALAASSWGERRRRYRLRRDAYLLYLKLILTGC